ncbi:hypothetical protein B0H14DRAFT_3022289 [Mycena olivaceomarginata]|nr:hypothetical protein B0H14DRAFT_3022289 [Mycena olivaceomarginata]
MCVVSFVSWHAMHDARWACVLTHHLRTSAPATAVSHRALGPRCVRLPGFFPPLPATLTRHRQLLTRTPSAMQASHAMRFVAPVCSAHAVAYPPPRFPLPHSTSPVRHVTCTCSACWRAGALLLRYFCNTTLTESIKSSTHSEGPNPIVGWHKK